MTSHSGTGRAGGGVTLKRGSRCRQWAENEGLRLDSVRSGIEESIIVILDKHNAQLELS